jgi:3-hydroxybutyryl-CoA dehydrogenase
VFNAMLNGLLSAAMNLAAGGVATVEDIDLAWTGVTKMMVGPFGILDVIGLDLACHITESIAEASGDPGIRAQAEFLRGYVDRGCLGIKSGRGFYEYV